MNYADAFLWMGVETLEQGFRSKAFSPVEVTRAVLDRIDALNPSWKIFITVNHEGALAAAQRAEKSFLSGDDPGPLGGIPIAVKDLMNTSDIRTTYGSTIFDQHFPTEEATVVTRIRQAGAVVVGKTNTDVFAFGVTTENPYYGTARNPWGDQRVSGGSSGGSASAVASGMATLALGSDTAGSIRIPASCCGIVGLKPTFGRVSKYGVMPLSWTLDHVGPLARSAKDAAVLLRAISGADPNDPFTIEHPPLPQWQAADFRGVRIGVPRNWFFANIEPEISDGVNRALTALQGLGAEVTEVSLPHTEKYFQVFAAVGRCEAAYDYEKYRSRFDEFPKSMHEWLDDGRSVDLARYLEATREREKIRQGLIGVMNSVDMLACPSMPMDVPHYGHSQLRVGDYTEDTHNALMRMHYPYNLSGQPALSVPCGMSKSGVPLGLQLAAKHDHDMRLLALAEAWLTEFPFAHAEL
jgi:aspartyl-tRNA(Asn)/glutamyl-tRNA(Gln) amidotransferase subunit A